MFKISNTIYGRELYSRIPQAARMESLELKVNGWTSSPIIAKHSVLGAYVVLDAALRT